MEEEENGEDASCPPSPREEPTPPKPPPKKTARPKTKPKTVPVKLTDKDSSKIKKGPPPVPKLASSSSKKKPKPKFAATASGPPPKPKIASTASGPPPKPKIASNTSFKRRPPKAKATSNKGPPPKPKITSTASLKKTPPAKTKTSPVKTKQQSGILGLNGKKSNSQTAKMCGVGFFGCSNVPGSPPKTDEEPRRASKPPPPRPPPLKPMNSPPRSAKRPPPKPRPSPQPKAAPNDAPAANLAALMKHERSKSSKKKSPPSKKKRPPPPKRKPQVKSVKSTSKRMPQMPHSTNVGVGKNKQAFLPYKFEIEKPKVTDFDLLKEIGRGSFGTVYQVRHHNSKKIFAMKVLKKKKIKERNQVEHTKTERLVLQLSLHPFLVTLRFAFQTPKKLYLVMDFYRGGELFFHLQKVKRFSERTVRLMVCEVTLALGHLHANGIIYRDLKPENILIDSEGHLAITDFGLAKKLKTGEAARTFCGTPEYLAPEVVRNKGHNKAVDWWSVGILAYELATGIPPFYSQNVNDMYERIKKAKLEWRRHEKRLTKGLRDFVARLLDRDPAKRLGSGPDDVDELLGHAFFSSMDLQKVMNREVKPSYKPAFKGKKNAEDTTNFETSAPKETYVNPSELARMGQDDDHFEGFTYQPTGFLGGAK